MTLKSGLAAQWGMVDEVTYGTAVTVTRFLPLVNESMSTERERLDSAGIIAGQRVQRSQQWSQGRAKPEGDVGFELYDRSMGLVFKHMFGNVVTAGAGPYTHTFTPGELSGKSFTMQIGRPDVSGTVQPFTYAGCKVSSWELAATAGEIVTLGLSLLAKSETTATALAAASYAAGIAPMTFVGSSLTIAGTAYPTLGVKLSGENGLDGDRFYLGTTTRDEPLEAELREYKGSIDSEFIDLAAYNRFVNGTEAALVITLGVGTSTCVITSNVRFDGETPNVGGTDIVKMALPFKCIGATTDAGALTAVLTNADAAI